MHRGELLRMLEGYDPQAPEELAAIGRFRALLEEQGDIFSRSHFSPGHVTASAVVVSKSGKQIALVDHTKLRVWLQPGGHVEPNDVSLSAAATREVIEECGPLQLRTLGLFDLDIHQLPANGNEPAHLHFDVRFLCRAVDGSLENTGEVNTVKWFRFDRPPSPLGSSVARLLAKARALDLA